MTFEQTTSIVNSAVDKLTVAPATASIASRIQLCQECIQGVAAVAVEWAEAAVVAKGLAKSSPVRAEDLLSGPAVVARQLQLTIQTLRAIEKYGHPALPGRVTRLKNGQLSVNVFPTSGLFDSLTFMGLRGSVRLQSDIAETDIHGRLPETAANDQLSRLTAVLGAGNVSSIPATDSLNRIMFEGSRVLLKFNPVNEYLYPIFEAAFAPLIKSNLLRLLKGGTDVGSALIQHDAVDGVHITGSAATHDAIVWGTDAADRIRRKGLNDPLLRKGVTSELGNVTPWIVVPGNYSTRQLNSQAQHIATSITNNASFNCLATKVIVTWKNWPQRNQFLQLIQHHLSQTPVRPAYYPGAAERFQRYSGTNVQTDDRGCLPWTLLIDQSITDRPELFQEESFVGVCAETQLGGKTAELFLAEATEFVNHQMTGTLCASVTIPAGFRTQQAQAFERCLSKLRYGSVCVNQWSGLAYGLTSPPWGAYPGATVRDVHSGIGNVHNTFLLDRVEKTVLEGPLINFPKPIWFTSHRNAVDVASRLVRLYENPSVLHLPGLFAAAISG